MVRDGDTPEQIGVAPTLESTPADDLGSAASLLRGLAETPEPAVPDDPLKPDQIVAEKYRVLRAIGQGGMGIVYLAHDQRLRRDVAIKLGSAGSATALARIEREGQALAKLSHPNVVVVYEVGETAGRVFVAMEHVTGGTARTWREAKPRTWREVVALYTAAGDGLAAAHAAGIVHRDFKPDNVLVGADGRPRVADFGLALAGEADELSTAGTPAYMAPEQRVAGAVVDARADQYAFAKALRQGLSGTEPPRSIDRALDRALAEAPADRWPAMTDLLAELRRDSGRTRRRIVISGLIAAALAAAIVVPYALRAPAAEPCSDADPQLAGIWNETRAAAIATAFGHAGGAGTWTTARPRLDRYAHELAAGHHDACHATVDGSQSDAMLDRRMSCLARARGQLQAILAGFAAADRTTVETAPGALSLLPDLGACADVEGLAKETPPPADPVARAAIDRELVEIGAANTRAIREDEKDPVGAGDRLLASAKAIGWPPLIAQAARVRANLLLDAHRDTGRVAMEDAIATAMASGDELVAAWAMADLARQLAVDHPADAKPWTDLARAIWSRRGEEPALGARILTAEIARAWTLDDGKTALALTRKQADLSQRAYGDDTFVVATRHHDLAMAHERNGQLDDGLREISLAVAAATKATGPDHPLVAQYLEQRAEIEQRSGAMPAALEDARRALAIDEAWYGTDDPHLAYPLDTIGFVLVTTGDAAGGRAMLTRERTILTAHDPSSPQLANLETNLGNMAAMDGNFTEAVASGQRALAAHKKWVGADNPALNADYILLGFSYRGLHQLDASETALREGVRVVQAKLGALHPDIVAVAIELSYTLVLENKAAEATALLAPLVALSEANPGVAPPTAAEAHTAYADALWKSGGDRAQARAAAITGRDAFVKLGEFQPQVDAATKWLAAHPGR